MSKIFLDHSFKCVKLRTLSSTPDMIINSLCSNAESYDTKKLITKISIVIIENRLYSAKSGHESVTSNSELNTGLLPQNSRFYTRGTNTNDVPDIKLIRDLIELKLKIDSVDEAEIATTDNNAEKLMTGHFRFYLPPVLAPQIVILIKCPEPNNNDLLLLYHGNPKFLPVFTSEIQYKYDCTISDVQINNDFMKLLMQWSVMNDTLDSIGEIELWFGAMPTEGKLGSILIKVKEKDIKVLKKLILTKQVDDDTSFGELLYKQLQVNTSVSFDQLSLVKLRSDLFSIDTNGKLTMFSTMSHLGYSEKLVKGDQRLSIWWIIKHLSDL